MAEGNKSFDEAMSESKNELEGLRVQLNDLMVKFGLRALRTYQTGKSYPLKPMEIKSLVKYELDNVMADVSQPENIESIIKKTALEWEKQQRNQGVLANGGWAKKDKGNSRVRFMENGLYGLR